jgi:hypothetical protein
MMLYTTRSGARQYKPHVASLIQACREENNTGFCLACGAEVSGIEPDARKATCEVCEAPKVYGAEQLLLMGLHHN